MRWTLIAETGMQQRDCLRAILLGHLSDGRYCGQTDIYQAGAGEPGPNDAMACASPFTDTFARSVLLASEQAVGDNIPELVPFT